MFLIVNLETLCLETYLKEQIDISNMQMKKNFLHKALCIQSMLVQKLNGES